MLSQEEIKNRLRNQTGCGWTEAGDDMVFLNTFVSNVKENGKDNVSQADRLKLFEIFCYSMNSVYAHNEVNAILNGKRIHCAYFEE